METTARSEKVVCKFKNPGSYSTGELLVSETLGPSAWWRWRLRVYPAGEQHYFEQTNTKGLAAFVELVPPLREIQDNWECEVGFSITLINREKKKNIGKLLRNTFTHQSRTYGYPCLISTSYYTSPAAGFVMNESNEVEIHAEVSGLPPKPTSEHLFESVELSAEPKFLKFHVVSGSPLFFDQRLLKARYQYFTKMLDETATWQESAIGEVDLRSDPKATHQNVLAILKFLLTDSFDPKGDVPFALAVRALADHFCIVDLVKLVDDTLTSLLTQDNVFTLLGKSADTGSKVEEACWKMLESNTELLVKHQESLDELLEEHPGLAKKLILMGRKKRRTE